MNRLISKYNPGYRDKYNLSVDVFNQMRLLVDEENSEFNESTGEGWANGTLLQDIGPVKVGTFVSMENDGDEITLCQWRNDICTLEYKFNIIIQKPVIVEPKRRI